MDSRVPWSDLPQELIAEIAKRLESPTEIKKFRAVCRTWLSSCPLSSKLLSLLLPHKIPIPLDNYFAGFGERLVLVASNIYLFRPPSRHAPGNHSNPWMVRVEELNPGFLQIQRPLTHNWNVDLPINFPMGLNMSQIRVTEVYKGYNLRRDTADNQGVLSGLDANKVVLYSHPLGESPATVGNFTAVVLFLVGRLYAVRLSNNHWESVKFGRVSRFDDVLNFKGKIVVIDRKGRLYRLCCSTLSYTCIVPYSVPSNPAAETRKHLVELSGELYLVHYVNLRFRVFRLNEELGLWTEVYKLGEDKILFLGPDCCFFALTEDFPGWRGNSIVYHIDSFRTYRRDGHVFYSMYDNPNRNIYFAVYHMGDLMSENIFSFVGYTDSLWPPPLWLRHPDLHPTVRAPLETLPEEAPDTNAAIVDRHVSGART